MKNFILNMIDTIKDKRFSWKFKILNILTNDWLRLELVYTNLYLKEAHETCDQFMEDRPLKSHIVKNLKNAKYHLNNIWGFGNERKDEYPF